ncbi:SpoIID/LytB domain-containing protein [Eubacteriales bacterium OttesenSCG-928-N13]|nr:SpoIID/LytB domain-containing protein [Eubacteriales bacterium OttesenSCG-928-N13]
MSKRWLYWIVSALLAALLLMSLAGCFPSANEVPEDGQLQMEPTEGPDDGMVSNMNNAPSLPDKLRLVDGVPQLKVYNVAENKVEEMDIEQYVEGVLAGEMRNDWPMEALKAQAILARTFVVKFVEEKTSKYPDADISTDIQEAQAYDAAAINERIKRAVEETRGQVLVSGDQFPYTWFHAHAGGQTELAKAALEYKPAEPQYTQSVQSPDSSKAPDAVKQWTATFTVDEVGAAADKTGVKVGKVTSIEIGEKGESGRAITLKINGKSVSVPALRLQLDSKKLKSTLLDSVKIEDGKVTFEGKGYGHGVGMSQWGAYGMADEGKDAEQIVMHYFRNVALVNAWQ